MKMSKTCAAKGPVQFALHATGMTADMAQDGAVTELMSENALLVRYIIW